MAHPEIIRRAEILHHPPVRATAWRGPGADHRRRIRQDRHLEAPARDLDGPVNLRPGSAAPRRHRPRAVRYPGTTSPAAIEPERHDRALGQHQCLALGQRVRDRSSAAGYRPEARPSPPSLARKAGPRSRPEAPPSPQSPGCPAPSARPAEDQRHHQRDHPGQPQRIGIARRQIRAPGHRPRRLGRGPHLRQMRLPQRALAADRRPVRQRGQRPAGQGPVQPQHDLLGPRPAGNASRPQPAATTTASSHSPASQPSTPAGTAAASPSQSGRQSRPPAASPAARRPAPPAPTASPAARAAQGLLHSLMWKNILGGPGAEAPGPAVVSGARLTSHAGMLSRASISSKVGRARMTAN